VGHLPAQPSFEAVLTDDAPGGGQSGLAPARLEPAGLAEAAERGRTVISRQAVEHITARLTADCPEVGGTTRRMLGVRERQGDALVAARLHGSTAVSLAVRCSVPYPHPVARSAEALRELLFTRVSELTGLRVQRVDVAVAELSSSPRGRRVR
jgi:uncharacterized alkaline shock family protein YloU